MLLTQIHVWGDTLSYDLDKQTLSGTGNVTIEYQKDQKYTLHCDHFLYDQKKNYFHALGKVEVLDEKGVRVLGSEFEVDDGFKNALARELEFFYQGHKYLTCCQAKRVNEKDLIISDSVFSSCDDPKLWSFHAKKIVYDHKKKVVSYRKGHFRVRQWKVLPVPYFSHPSFFVRRMEGLLAPTLIQTEDQGFGGGLSYYYPINDLTDVVLSPYVMSKYGFLMSAELRHQTQHRIRWRASFALPWNKKKDAHFSADLENRFWISDQTELEMNLNRADCPDYLSHFWMVQNADFLYYKPLISTLRVRHVYDRGDLSLAGYSTQDRNPESVHHIFPMVRWRHTQPLPYGSIDLHNECGQTDQAEVLHQATWSYAHVLRMGMLAEVQLSEQFLRDQKTNSLYPKGHWKLSYPVGNRHIVLEPFAQGTYTRPQKEQLRFMQRGQPEIMPYYTSPYELMDYHTRHFGGLKGHIGRFRGLIGIDKKDDHASQYHVFYEVKPRHAFYWQNRQIWDTKGNLVYGEHGAYLHFSPDQEVYCGVFYDKDPYVHVNVNTKITDRITIRTGYIGNPQDHLAYYGTFGYENECVKWELGVIQRNTRNRLIDREIPAEGLSVVFRFFLKWQKNGMIAYDPPIPYSPLARW